MSTSTIPDAYDALVDTLTPLLEAVSATLHDGPPIANGHPDYVCIGHDPSSGEDSTTTETSWVAIGAMRQKESFRIPCLIVVPTGDATFTVARRRAYELFDVILNALIPIEFPGRQSPLQVVEHALLQERSETGLAAGIRFTIACSDARYSTT